jgi:hypothetical protein
VRFRSGFDKDFNGFSMAYLRKNVKFILVFAGVFEHRLFLVVLFVLSVSLSISSSFLLDF